MKAFAVTTKFDSWEEYEDEDDPKPQQLTVQ